MGVLKAGSVDLPAPVQLSVDDEIIWASNAGRSVKGNMLGDIVAEKKTLKIEWMFLTEAQMLLIKNNLKSGFFPITFHDDGIDLTISAYRGTLSKEMLGDIGDGVVWYRSVSVSIIQQ